MKRAASAVLAALAEKVPEWDQVPFQFLRTSAGHEVADSAIPRIGHLAARAPSSMNMARF